MPRKQPQRVETRKSVSRRFRAFVNASMKQFATPPEELLSRAEAKLHTAPPKRDDKASEAAGR
jgi:hypothetical protein